MNNPKNVIIFDFFRKSEKDVDKIFLETDNVDSNIYLYKLTKSLDFEVNKPEIEKVSVKQINELLNSIMGDIFIFKDNCLYEKSINKKIEFIRLSLPDCLLQIDYENKKNEVIGISDEVSIYIRKNCLKKVNK